MDRLRGWTWTLAVLLGLAGLGAGEARAQPIPEGKYAGSGWCSVHGTFRNAAEPVCPRCAASAGPSGGAGGFGGAGGALTPEQQMGQMMGQLAVQVGTQLLTEALFGGSGDAAAAEAARQRAAAEAAAAAERARVERLRVAADRRAFWNSRDAALSQRLSAVLAIGPRYGSAVTRNSDEEAPTVDLGLPLTPFEWGPTVTAADLAEPGAELGAALAGGEAALPAIEAFGRLEGLANGVGWGPRPSGGRPGGLGAGLRGFGGGGAGGGARATSGGGARRRAGPPKDSLDLVRAATEGVVTELTKQRGKRLEQEFYAAAGARPPGLHEAIAPGPAPRWDSSLLVRNAGVVSQRDMGREVEPLLPLEFRARLEPGSGSLGERICGIAALRMLAETLGLEGARGWTARTTLRYLAGDDAVYVMNSGTDPQALRREANDLGFRSTFVERSREAPLEASFDRALDEGTPVVTRGSGPLVSVGVEEATGLRAAGAAASWSGRHFVVVADRVPFDRQTKAQQALSGGEALYRVKDPDREVQLVVRGSALGRFADGALLPLPPPPPVRPPPIAVPPPR